MKDATPTLKKQFPKLDLVPSPPPYTPSVVSPYGFGEAPAAPAPVQLSASAPAAPLADASAAPTAMPQPLPANLSSPTLIDPTLYQAQQNRLAMLDAATQTAKSKLDQAADEHLSYDTPQPTSFEKMMQQGLQSHIMELLSQKDSKLDRFNKGWDIGQKIAAGILVPAFGGRGAGAMSMAMQQQVSQQEAARAAEKNAHNQMLMNLANIYEGIDPNSSKNVAALMGHRLSMYKMDQDNKNAALKNYMDALQNSTSEGQKLLSFKADTGAKETEAQTKAFEYNNDKVPLDTAGVKKTQTETAQLPDKLQLEKDRLAVEQGNLKVNQDRAAQTKENEGKKIDQEKDKTTIEGTKLQQAALDKIRLFDEHLRKEMGAVGPGGVGHKYSNTEQFVKNNPAEVEMLDQLFKQGKLGTTGKQYLDSIFANSQQPATPQGGHSLLDFFNNAASAVQNMGGKVDAMPTPKAEQTAAPPATPQGKSQPAAETPAKLPEHKVTTLSQARERLKARGEKITPEALVKEVNNGG